MKKYQRPLMILFLSIITVILLLRLGEIDISLETLRRVQWPWLLTTFVTFYLSILARGWRWRRILNVMGWPIKTGYAHTLLIAGLFISAILPARAGDIGRVTMLRQDYKIPIAQGIGSIAAERALDVFAILTLAIIGSILALQGRIPSQFLPLMLGASFLFILGLVGLFAIPGLERWFRHPGKIVHYIPPKLWTLYQKALDFGFELLHSVQRLGRNPRLLTVIIIESFIIWFYDCLAIHFLLSAVGVPSPFNVSMFTSMVSALAAAIPITPGALGQFDMALIGLLSLFGIATTHSTLLTLLLRFVNFWTFLLVGGLVTYVFGFSRALNLNQQPFKEITEEPSARNEDALPSSVVTLVKS